MFDSTTKDDIQRQFSNYKNVVLLEYRYNKLFMKKDGVHYGYLGALLRFLPYFNWEGNPFERVAVIDADMTVAQVKTIINLTNNLNKIVKNGFFFIDDVSNKLRYAPVINSVTQPTPLLIYSYHFGDKLPLNLLEGFLDRLTEDKDSNDKKTLEKYYDFRKNFNFKTRASSLEEAKHLVYGFDEIFAIKYLVPYIENNIREVYYSEIWLNLSTVFISMHITLDRELGEEYRKTLKLKTGIEPTRDEIKMYLSNWNNLSQRKINYGKLRRVFISIINKTYNNPGDVIGYYVLNEHNTPPIPDLEYIKPELIKKLKF